MKRARRPRSLGATLVSRWRGIQRRNKIALPSEVAAALPALAEMFDRAIARQADAHLRALEHINNSHARLVLDLRAQVSREVQAYRRAARLLRRQANPSPPEKGTP